MILARVEGSVTSTRKHPSFAGWKLLICQPVDPDGGIAGAPVVAIDPHGAGIGDHVVVSTDGKAARIAVRDDKSPVRHMIVGIADNGKELSIGRETVRLGAGSKSRAERGASKRRETA